jgi:hypothetical protein
MPRGTRRKLADLLGMSNTGLLAANQSGTRNKYLHSFAEMKLALAACRTLNEDFLK